MFVYMLKRLWPVALSAPPFLLIVTGCSFSARSDYFYPGEAPQDTAIFCDIERGRECATVADLANGVDITRPQEALWGGKSSMFGLDYSAEATARCDGLPQKVLYQGAYPEGSAVCLNGNRFGDEPVLYNSVKAACEAWCTEHAKAPDSSAWIDNDGNRYKCDHVAWPAFRAEAPVANACGDSGTLRADFSDARKLPPGRPVVWTNIVNLEVTPPDNSGLKKTMGVEEYDAGAASSTILGAGADGYFEFTATETDAERTGGLAIGPLPDLDPSNGDIAYAVLLRKTGELLVTEAGVDRYAGPYEAGDVIRIASIGGRVHYFRNGTLLYASTTPVGLALLRASVSIRDLKGTIAEAHTSF